MKKMIVEILACVCILSIPVQVYAKDEDVTISTATAEETEVSVSGTSDALAVAVQVRSADGTILGMTTLGTVDQKFDGKVESLNLVSDTEYTVYIADYEGGDWSKKEVIYGAATTEATTAATTAATTEAVKSPATGDSAVPVAAFALLGVSGLLALVLCKKCKNRA